MSLSLRAGPAVRVCNPANAVASLHPGYKSTRGFLPHRQLPVRANEVAGVTVGDALQVVLVLRFGFPEIARGCDFSDGLAGPQARGIHIGDRVFGDAFLLVVGVEDRRAVAGADVVALAIHRGRVVDLEKEFQQRAVADARRIEGDLDRFGVGAVVAVRGIGNVAAGIADARRNHAGLLADQVLHAPEAAAGKDGALGSHDWVSKWLSSFRTSPRSGRDPEPSVFRFKDARA